LIPSMPTMANPDMQTAILSLIGSARLFQSLDCDHEAAGLLRLIFDIGLRAQVQLRLGKTPGPDVTPESALFKLRAARVIDNQQYETILGGLRGRRMSEKRFVFLLSVARELLDVLEPYGGRA
jgi:hypothetical protein